MFIDLTLTWGWQRRRFRGLRWTAPDGLQTVLGGSGPPASRHLLRPGDFWAWLEKPSFFKEKFLKVFRFLGFMYEHQTQNYDPKIHKDYLIHDTPQPCADYSIAINTTN